MAVDILYVNIKHGLALVVFIDRDAEHIRQALEPMADDILFPHVVVQSVGTRVILLEALGVSLARQAHLYSLVRKEEILRVRRVCGEVKVNLLQRLKSSRGELGGIEHQVKDIAVFEAVNHPPANELTNILDVDLFDNVALDANELSDR